MANPIPRDVREAAKLAAGKALYAQSRGEDVAWPIMNAIMLERQRCANAARKRMSVHVDRDSINYTAACEEIEADILAGAA